MNKIQRVTRGVERMALILLGGTPVVAVALSLSLGVVGEAWAQTPEQFQRALGLAPAAEEPTPKPKILQMHGTDPVPVPVPVPPAPTPNPCGNTRSTDGARGCETALINFEFNSATLTPTGASIVDNLGAAVRTSNLQGVKLRIIGHTDAKGGEEYNQDLSERRAKTVRDVLVKRHHLNMTMIETEGRGKSELKYPDNPESAENRRVQILRVD